MRIDRVSNLYTVEGAAKALGVSTDSLLRRIHAGVLPAVEVGRSHLIDLNDVREVPVRRYSRKAAR